MMTFDMLSALVRALFALWALMLCVLNIGNAVLAVVRKRFRFSACALVLFAPAYFLWQVIFDFSLFGNTGNAAAVTASVCGIGAAYWLTAFVLLTAAALLLMRQNVRYGKNFITPGTIKLYLDEIPCGICCWRENGRVLFSNIRMNELCLAVTGKPLLSGNDFYAAVNDGILTVEGKVWRFARREIESDGEKLYEMIASDITAEYAKTEALEKDKAELSRLNAELHEYYLSIDETVKRREILQAKMNIHDEMNRLMLLTVAADKENNEALDGIFALWEKNALLLCMEADKKTSAQQAYSLDSLSDALGISLLWNGELPEYLNEKQKELFFFAAQEAVVNAVKHAQADKMEIIFEKNGNTPLCRFKNNGNIPFGEVRFEGGLANIARLAEQQGATVFTEIGEEFALVLKYPPIG